MFSKGGQEEKKIRVQEKKSRNDNLAWDLRKGYWVRMSRKYKKPFNRRGGNFESEKSFTSKPWCRPYRRVLRGGNHKKARSKKRILVGYTSGKRQSIRKPWAGKGIEKKSRETDRAERVVSSKMGILVNLKRCFP